MSFTGNSAQMAAEWKRRANTFPRRLRGAAKEVDRETLRFARMLSSGSLTYADLERMGHPYAVRNPTSPTPYLLNVHDGTVLNGWTMRSSSYGGSLNIKQSLFNSSPWMPYLIGYDRPASLMIRRPIDNAIMLLMRPVLNKTYRQAVFLTLV